MSPWIGLIILICLYPIAKIIAGKNIEKTTIKSNAEIEVRKIKDFSTSLAEVLSNEFQLDYNTILFEELIFFYFLFVVDTVDLNKNEEVCGEVEKILFSNLKNDKTIGFTTYDIYNRRKNIYSEILNKHDLKHNSSFFTDIFEYQAHQFTKEPEKISDIISFLKDNLNIFFNFFE